MNATPDVPPAAADTITGPGPAADAPLTERCQTSGDYLAGLIAAATLETVAHPDKLPTLLWPDAEPWIVDDIWKTALAVGYHAGKMSGRPQWTNEGFHRLRAALKEAGYRGMARHVARTADLHHPADQEHGTTRPRDTP
ncbi:hypothetical protein [Streptomyces sp. NPDC005407]|uniref:hypothetical protein n=1 Tax=Streptomyces sp. NPDC005407 TaxID=3155340 RepID=UPI0033A7B67A